jgi:hypothetical protein
MARALVRLFGVVLLLALGACGGGCAGRRADDAVAPPVAAAESPAETAPAPPRAPVVPPGLACSTDADCTTTPFSRAVASPDGCYCPTCPAPLAARQAQQNEASWQSQCGAEWEARARCQAPMCRRPGAPVCRAGACVAGTGG